MAFLHKGTLCALRLDFLSYNKYYKIHVDVEV